MVKKDQLHAAWIDEAYHHGYNSAYIQMAWNNTWVDSETKEAYNTGYEDGEADLETQRQIREAEFNKLNKKELRE